MAKKSNPFIAGKQYGDVEDDPAEPDADDMGPPKSLAARKKTESKDKGPRAKAPPKSYY